MPPLRRCRPRSAAGLLGDSGHDPLASRGCTVHDRPPASSRASLTKIRGLARGYAGRDVGRDSTPVRKPPALGLVPDHLRRFSLSALSHTEGKTCDLFLGRAGRNLPSASVPGHSDDDPSCIVDRTARDPGPCSPRSTAGMYLLSVVIQ